MSQILRLQNYPAIQFATADEWSDFLARTCATARIETPGRAGHVDWRLHAASLTQLGIAFGAHGSPLDLVHSGGGSGMQIFVPLAGMAELSRDGRSFPVAPGQALLIDLSQPSRFRVSATFRTIALDIPERTMREQFSARADRAVQEAAGPDPVIDLGWGAGAALASIVETLVTGLESDLWQGAPNAAAGLTQALLSLLAETSLAGWSGAAAATPSAAPRQVRRAIAFMRAQIAEPLTIAEIAEASQSSVRSLQRVFKKFRSSTPLAYLRQLRLEAVHKELSDAGNTLSVAKIAMKWGFVHFGRFSAEYRGAFGQLPSATARAARRR